MELLQVEPSSKNEIRQILPASGVMMREHEQEEIWTLVFSWRLEVAAKESSVSEFRHRSFCKRAWSTVNPPPLSKEGRSLHRGKQFLWGFGSAQGMRYSSRIAEQPCFILLPPHGTWRLLHQDTEPVSPRARRTLPWACLGGQSGPEPQIQPPHLTPALEPAWAEVASVETVGEDPAWREGKEVGCSKRENEEDFEAGGSSVSAFFTLLLRQDAAKTQMPLLSTTLLASARTSLPRLFQRRGCRHRRGHRHHAACFLP